VRAASASLTRETIEGAIRIYHALRGLAEEHRLSALTVRCFDLIGPLRNTGCYASPGSTMRG
jgi:hypothetical protein